MRGGLNMNDESMLGTFDCKSAVGSRDARNIEREGYSFLAKALTTALGRLMKSVIVLAVSVVLSTHAAYAADKPVVRVAVLKFGTVNWFLDTMIHNKLDLQNDFKLEIVPLASKTATSVAFLSDSVDAFVTDWFWAMGERSKGNMVSFLPYSSTLGAVMLPPPSTAQSFEDLSGKKIGIAGGPLDKSWLLMQTLARKQGVDDLAKTVSPVFAAPPLLNAQIEQGALDGVLNFWHFAARLKGKGYRTFLSVEDTMADLGITPAPPLIGFVHGVGTGASDKPQWAQFATAMEATNEVLRTSDSAWERLRKVMRAGSDEEFVILRDTYRKGILGKWNATHSQSAGKLFALMAEIGGEKVIGAGVTFDPGLFPSNDP